MFGHRRGAGVEATGVGGRRVVGDVHAEDVLVGEPAGLGGKQVGQQPCPDVEEAEAGGGQQVLDRSPRDEVHAERGGVEVDRADGLIAVGEDERSAVVGDACDRGDVLAVTGAIGDRGAAHEGGAVVDRSVEGLDRDDPVGTRPDVDDLGAAQRLRMRDLADGGELVVGDHDPGAGREVEGADDPAHALGHGRGHRELRRRRVEQPRERPTRRFGPLHPVLPLGAVRVPAGEVLLVGSADAVRERALRAGVEVGGRREDGELAPDRLTDA